MHLHAPHDTFKDKPVNLQEADISDELPGASDWQIDSVDIQNKNTYLMMVM